MKITSKILLSFTAGLAVLIAGPTLAASQKEARVTQIVHDVKLTSQSTARPAVVNDKVAEDTGVRTGGDSRSELTFADMTITRLGANTIFSFSNGGRTAKVDGGAILLRVPKDSGGGNIKTNAVTVAVTGTTVIFEKARGTKSKLITLEGSARMALVAKPGDVRTVRAGQMLDVPAGATTLGMPVNTNLNDVMNNHPLITDFPPLPSKPLIMAAAQQQPPPLSSSGPNIPIVPIINILGGFTGGTTVGPQRNPTRPPRQPPGTTNGTNDGPTNTPTPTNSRTPGQTKTPPPVTNVQKYPKAKPTPTPPRIN